MKNRTISLTLAGTCLLAFSMASAFPADEYIFSREMLKPALKINLQPQVAHHVEGFPATPLRLARGGPTRHYPYDEPTALARGGNDAYFVLNLGAPFLIIVPERGEIQGLDIPRRAYGDMYQGLAVDETVMYSPVTGMTPPATVLMKFWLADQQVGIPGMVGWYTYDLSREHPLRWERFLQVAEGIGALPPEERGDVMPSSWGIGLVVEGDGNVAVSFDEKKARKAAVFDKQGRFVRVVPSHLRDDRGYYYQVRYDSLFVYDPQEKLEAIVRFTGPDAGLTNERWQASARGVWIKIALDQGKDQRYVLLGSDGKPKAWFACSDIRLNTGEERTLLNPFFSRSGVFCYGAIEVTPTPTGAERAAYVIYGSPLKLPGTQDPR